MAENRWTVAGKVAAGKNSTRIKFGPSGDSMPSEFAATVRYDGEGLELHLSCAFDGQQIAVREVRLRPIGERGLAAKDMTRLELAAVVRDVGSGAVQPGHGSHVDQRLGAKPTDEELRLLASVYWFHHVTWGDPRRAVMAIWGLPRTTANRWITQAHDLYGLPGRHSQED